MGSLFNSCRSFREKISLLASDALAVEEGAELQGHLAACAECRRYHNEIAKVAAGLVNWKQSFASVTPSEAALARWKGNFAQEIKSDRALSRRVFEWCRDVIWPYRHAWAGFATIWAVLLALNVTVRDPIRVSASKGSSPSPELVRAFFQGENFIGRSDNGERKNSNPPESHARPSEQNPGATSINSNSI